MPASCLIISRESPLSISKQIEIGTSESTNLKNEKREFN